MLMQVLGFMVLLSGTSVYNELLRAWLPDVFSRTNSLASLQEAEVCMYAGGAALPLAAVNAHCKQRCQHSSNITTSS